MEKLSLECEPGVVTEDRADWRRRFIPLDIIVFSYTAIVAVFTAIFHETLPDPFSILALHVFVLVTIIVLPPRGARWETVPVLGWKRHVRGGVRFLRYSYPLPLILFYFEEGAQTVNAMWTTAPHWFETHLYAADRWLFGELPSISLNPWVGFLQDEIIHGFYFSFYLILIGGVVIAWLGEKGSPKPAPDFQTALTAAITAFFLCFLWYPYLPARGPWENPELMASMTPFEGFLFVPVIETIIQHGAVSGGCFPSAHVAGAWGIVFGLLPFQRKKALILGFFALGMSLACVYTRYHHAVDVPTGFLAGLLGSLITGKLTGVKSSSRRTS